MKKVLYYGTRKKELGKDIAYRDIDRKKLTGFSIVKNGKNIFTLYLEDDKKLFWRQRELITIGGKRTKFDLVGYTKNEGKDKMIAAVLDNGEIHIVGEFIKNHKLFDKINFSNQEI